MQSIVITQVQDVDYIESCLKDSVTMILWEVPNSVMLLNDVVWEQVSGVVVAVRDEWMKREIMVWLTNYISEQIIIDFWQIYNASIPIRRADKILMNPSIPEFEGLILGISHAEVGLLSDLFDVPFANLAVSSQDIYYNYKTLKYAVENYYHKLQNVKYVIIDMFRYNYFNYDVSKSRTAMSYYQTSGIFDDAHFFEEEKCKMLEEYVLTKRLQGITEYKLDLWEHTFGDVHQRDGYKGFETWPEIYRRNQIVDDNTVLEYDYNKSIVKKRFDNTIQENIEYFKQMLLLIKECWPEARIMVFLMPLYELALKQSESLYVSWKQEFEGILQRMQEVAAFEYFDYTYHDISKKKQYWQDFEHLNYTGAICFTKEINEMI